MLIDNIKLKCKNYFWLSTKKIALLGVLLAFNIVLVIVSQYTVGLMLVGGFFVIEIAFIGILVSYFCFNLFYASLILLISSYLRLGLRGEIVGVTVGYLIDQIFLCLFVFFSYWTDKTFKNKILKILLIGFGCALLTAGIAGLMNYTFILDWYNNLFGLNLPVESYPTLVVFAIISTFFKFVIAIILYALMFNSLTPIRKNIH